MRVSIYHYRNYHLNNLYKILKVARRGKWVSHFSEFSQIEFLGVGICSGMLTDHDHKYEGLIL